MDDAICEDGGDEDERVVTIDDRDFGRLEEKADQIYATLREHVADDRAWHERIDERLRKIEEGRAHSAGRLSVISALVSTVVAGVVAWTVKHLG